MEIECLSCKDPDLVFVFGSNLAGRHGLGAAAHAVKFHGAQRGLAISYPIKEEKPESYAIPTKDEQLRPLPLWAIRKCVVKFIEYAESQPALSFNVTRIGCGLAGYKDEDIAPMFEDAPPNCILPDEWKEILQKA